MTKNLYARILREKPKTQHLSTIPKSCPFIYIYIYIYIDYLPPPPSFSLKMREYFVLFRKVNFGSTRH